jgi:hypothetical protein
MPASIAGRPAPARAARPCSMQQTEGSWLMLQLVR